ncbi:hypothetical protein BT67DRAFT_443938 [Trichocladium antarcticum]|uniref:Uncharacterized protein n=1 Tax=Trichocladium antarcticum TaxID=1450529 RepID=A0AAN6UGC0_9PEZI|nr:hypothetical protein BT67DRAFT_443938 [Trichocladium antarcticum]
MCIKLTRHFQCSETVAHTCEYLVRCSTPFVWSEHIINGWDDQPCLEAEELDVVEQWYDEPCSYCTGELCVPKTRPVRVNMRFGRGSTTTSLGEAAEGGAVAAYAEHLGRWLVAYLYEPSSDFFWSDAYLQQNVMDRGTMDQRHMTILGELTCQIRPEHGCQWKFGRSRVWNDNTQTMEDGDSLTLLPVEPCDCVSTRDPWLSNWALHVRRVGAARVLQNSARASDDRTYIGQALREEIYQTQERLIKSHVEIRRNILRFSALGKYPMLEVVPMERAQREQRADLLAQDNYNLVVACLGEVAQLGPAERRRCQSRSEVMIWVRLILAYDSGLTTQRARAILAFFAARVVKYDASWEGGEHHHLTGILELDACRRLAYLANRCGGGLHDRVMATWREFSNERGSAFPTQLETRWADWERLDRARADAVRRGIVRPTQAELDEMRKSGDGDVCAVCLDRFGDHESAVSKLPVRNWKCSLNGSGGGDEPGTKHWCGAVCLMKYARTLQGSSAPTPRCPICRTEF